MFFCRTRTGKTIELFDEGATIRYVYTAANGEREMDLSVPRAEATTIQWDGMTSAIAYSVQIPNGRAVYSVFWLGERNPDAGEPVTGGVNVEVNGEHAAIVQCVPSSIDGSLEDIDLRAASL